MKNKRNPIISEITKECHESLKEVEPLREVPRSLFTEKIL